MYPYHYPDELEVPANIAKAVATARLPKNYERAKQALTECNRLDQCLTWADKAAAIASYARQADDKELENYARRIRARAYRRLGELLREIAPSRGGRRRSETCGDAPTSSRSQAARDAGLSRDQKVTALRIAAIPGDDFEAEIESDRPPGTMLLAQMGKRPPIKPVLTLTAADFDRMKRTTDAGRVLDGLRSLAWYADKCDVAAVLEVILDPPEHRAGESAQLIEEFRRAIDLVLKVKTALDRAGVRSGGPGLKAVE